MNLEAISSLQTSGTATNKGVLARGSFVCGDRGSVNEAKFVREPRSGAAGRRPETGNARRRSAVQCGPSTVRFTFDRFVIGLL